VSPYEDAKDDQNRVNAVGFEEVPMATQDSPSLYDRLGSVYSIATVMDDFIDRIMVDPRLNANPRVDEAHHRVSPFDRESDSFIAVIRCTSADEAGSKTISKWARALRYVARYKKPGMPLKTFMKEAGRGQRVRRSLREILWTGRPNERWESEEGQSLSPSIDLI
jgi:hypothetical protein